MQALKERPVDTPVETRPCYDLEQLRDLVHTLFLEATSQLAPTRIDDTAHRWLSRLDTEAIPPGDAFGVAAEALTFAAILAVFTPAGGGSTAIDRLARRRKPGSPDEATALAGLARTRFHLLQVESVAADGSARLRDLASGEAIQLVEGTLPEGCVGVHLAAWLLPLPDHRFLAVAETPLDEACLRIASGFIRPGRAALVNPINCAEAIYRHVLRHGSLRVPGLNDPGEDDDVPEPGTFDHFALLWSDPAAPRDPDDRRFVRAERTSGLPDGSGRSTGR